MTIVEMLAQSGILTMLGVGIVFGFLIILVAAVNVMGKLIGAKSPGNDTAGSFVQTTSPEKVTGTDDGAQITAAISAAVSEYRKSH